MVDYISKGHDRIPLANVFQSLLRTIIPLIGTLNKENNQLVMKVRNLEQQVSVKDAEQEAYEIKLNSLDLKKDIDRLKDDKKELIRLNGDMNLKLKNLKIQYNSMNCII